MSERENPIGPLTRQESEKLKAYGDIGEHKPPQTSGIREKAIRTEGDGKSAEPVVEDLYIEKTNNKIAKEETLQVNAKPAENSVHNNSNLANIMSRKPNDDKEDSNESYSADEYEEKEGKTDSILTKAEADLLNSKYAEDNEVNYNDFYENLPSQDEEDENYLPEEFRVPSNLSSASSTISEISERKPTRRRNCKDSEDEAKQNQASLDNIPDNGEIEEKDREEEDEGNSADSDQDISSSQLQSESEEESDEEEETEEEEEETKEEEEEEKVEDQGENPEEDDGYKSSSVASVSSVPTFYSDQEEEAEATVSRPTTADLTELQQATGEEAPDQPKDEDETNNSDDGDGDLQDLNTVQDQENLDEFPSITREVSGRSASPESVVHSDFDDLESTIFIGREGSQLGDTTKNRGSSSAHSNKSEVTLRNWSRFTHVSSLSQEKKNVTTEEDKKADKTRKKYKKKRTRTDKRIKSIKALENIAKKKRKETKYDKRRVVAVLERQWSTSSEEQLLVRPKRKLKTRRRPQSAEKTSDLNIEGEHTVLDDSPFSDAFTMNRKNEEPSPTAISAESCGRASDSWSGFQSDSAKESIEPNESRASSPAREDSMASSVKSERINSCRTIIEHSRPSSYGSSRSSTKDSLKISKNINKVRKENLPPSKIRVIGPLKLENITEKKKKPLPPIKKKTYQARTMSGGKKRKRK